MKAETDSGDVRLTLMLHMRELFAMWVWQRHKYQSHYLLLVQGVKYQSAQTPTRHHSVGHRYDNFPWDH